MIRALQMGLFICEREDQDNHIQGPILFHLVIV